MECKGWKRGKGLWCVSGGVAEEGREYVRRGRGSKELVRSARGRKEE